MSDYGMPSAPWNQPYGTPTGSSSGTMRFTCPDCGESVDLDWSEDRSVGWSGCDETPYCSECDKEIEGDGDLL